MQKNNNPMRKRRYYNLQKLKKYKQQELQLQQQQLKFKQIEITTTDIEKRYKRQKIIKKQQKISIYLKDKK